MRRRTALTRKTALRRASELRAKTPLYRNTPMKAVNPERNAKRYARDFGSKADWIRDKPCLVCGTKPSDPHHWPTRGAGGTSKDLIPLCRTHHVEFHTMGVDTWQDTYQRDIDIETAIYHQQWRDECRLGDT